MVQQLETEVQNKQMEADKLLVEKNANQQRIKILEHEMAKNKKVDGGSSEMSGYQKLQAEYEELKITNQVYLERINEFVDEINQMRDDPTEKRVAEANGRASELEAELANLQRQLKETGNDNGRMVSDSMTVKTSISKTNFGQSDDVNVLRKEIDTLKQRIVILTDKNMEYHNALTDIKNRDRSRSKNVKK